MSRSIYSEWLNYSRHGCMILNIHPQAPLSHPRRRKEYPHNDSPSRNPHIGERGYWNRRLQEEKRENWIITVSALGITHSRPDKILFSRVHDIKKWNILFVCTLFCCLHSVFKCFSMYSIFAYQVFRFISRIEHLASEDERMPVQVSDVINFSYVCLFVCLFLGFMVPLENFSLIWRRHHCRFSAPLAGPTL